MEWVSRVLEVVSAMVVSTALSLIAAIFVVLGVTFLPVFGIVIAVTLIRLAIFLPTLKTTGKFPAIQAAEMGEKAAYCLWPYHPEL